MDIHVKSFCTIFFMSLHPGFLLLSVENFSVWHILVLRKSQNLDYWIRLLNLDYCPQKIKSTPKSLRSNNWLFLRFGLLKFIRDLLGYHENQGTTSAQSFGPLCSSETCLQILSCCAWPGDPFSFTVPRSSPHSYIFSIMMTFI